MTTNHKACIFDNDSTWRREVWRDGELWATFSAEFVMSVTKENRWLMPPYEAMMTARPWRPGNLVGDPEAKEPQP